MTDTTRYINTLSYNDTQLLRKREFELRAAAYNHRKIAQNEGNSFAVRYKACITSEHLFQIANVYTDALSGKISLNDSVKRMTDLRKEFSGSNNDDLLGIGG